MGEFESTLFQPETLMKPKCDCVHIPKHLLHKDNFEYILLHKIDYPRMSEIYAII